MSTIKWTVTLEHGDPEWDPEYEKEISKILQEEIDWEILCDMMVTLGYTKVELHFKNNNHAVDIKNWLDENCNGKVQSRASIFLFEKTEEAEWFSLRWL